MFITKEYELFKEIGLPFQVTFISSYPSLVTFLFVSILLNTSCSFLPLHPFCFPHHLTLEHSSLSFSLKVCLLVFSMNPSALNYL